MFSHPWLRKTEHFIFWAVNVVRRNVQVEFLLELLDYVKPNVKTTSSPPAAVCSWGAHWRRFGDGPEVIQPGVQLPEAALLQRAETQRPAAREEGALHRCTCKNTLLTIIKRVVLRHIKTVSSGTSGGPPHSPADVQDGERWSAGEH